MLITERDQDTIPSLSGKNAARNFKDYYYYFKKTKQTNKNVFFQGAESKELSQQFCIDVLDFFIEMKIPVDKTFNDFLQTKFFQEKIVYASIQKEQNSNFR